MFIFEQFNRTWNKRTQCVSDGALSLRSPTFGIPTTSKKWPLLATRTSAVGSGARTGIDIGAPINAAGRAAGTIMPYWAGAGATTSIDIVMSTQKSAARVSYSFHFNLLSEYPHFKQNTLKVPWKEFVNNMCCFRTKHLGHKSRVSQREEDRSEKKGS